jgi:hypothetical protein
MTRQEVITALVRMLRPLEPEGDPVQREEEDAAWATRAADDARTMIELLGLARNPPTAAERGRVSEDAFQVQLAHVLSVAGAHAPAATLDQLGPLTQDPHARATAIEVIGAIGDPAGLRWLVPLVDAGDLSDDEATWLASSLGDIGTAEAMVLLDRLAARTAGERASVHREIQIARDAIARRIAT